MEKIPFADYVVNDMATRGSLIYDSFMGGEYLSSVDVGKCPAYRGLSNGHENRDDWSLTVTWSWPFINKAYLTRGKEYVKIVLTRAQNKALIAAWDARWAEQKAINNKAKLAKKAFEQEMQDWP